MADINTLPGTLEGEEVPEEIIPDPIITVTVGKDKMTVFVKVKVFDDSQVTTKEEILAKLKEKQVVYGIDEGQIESFCAGKKYYKEIRAAIGLKPIPGEDGRVEYHFDTDVDKGPKEAENGTVDYKNFNAILNVLKGELLATIVYATDGEDGMDVLGKTVKAKKGRVPSVPSGKNITFSADKTEVFAGIDGAIQHTNNKLNIEEVYNIRGDVGPVTGNIKFNGDVIVGGNVLEGFSITAQKSITVKGYVEGATLIAQNNIIINMGFNGMNKGILRAEGDIITKFVENGKVECRGTLRTDVALHSHIKAGEAIIVKGQKGVIMNGTYLAGTFIYAKNIGTDNRNDSVLTVNANWYEMEQNLEGYSGGVAEQVYDKDIILRQLRKNEEEIKEITERIEAVNNAQIDESMQAKRLMVMRTLILSKSELIAKQNRMTQQIAQIAKMEEERSNAEQKIIFTGTLYAGARITINYATIKLQDTLVGQKFHLVDGALTLGIILPHEKDIS